MQRQRGETNRPSGNSSTSGTSRATPGSQIQSLTQASHKGCTMQRSALGGDVVDHTGEGRGGARHPLHAEDHGEDDHTATQQW